jgi:uncharacterized repeat protein (TIGR03803 family)
VHGTSYQGGVGYGVVWELTPSSQGWTLSDPYSFSGPDGSFPLAGVTLDQSGNLYGTTTGGGVYGNGTVFHLTPSGSGWTLNPLYAFQPVEGEYPPYPYSTLVLGNSSTLYGSTSTGGSRNGGAVFQLTSANGNWTFSEVYGFAGPAYPFSGPDGNLTMDNLGNLYGVTEKEGGSGCGGYGCGTIFKLSPGGSGWTLTSLDNFTGDDGSDPGGNVVIDSSGNLYGTTQYSGAYGRGVVWEITP